jgi:hypothetical protein
LERDLVCGFRLAAKDLFELESRVTDISEALFWIFFHASSNQPANRSWRIVWQQ